VEASDTLYLFIADHGHMYSDPRKTVYINQRIPILGEWLSVSPTGNPIYPNGSPRDLFLHIKPERIKEAFTLLEKDLSDIALIMPVETALEQQLFGPEPVSTELRHRLGDILILAYSGHFIFWYEPGLMENHAYGHHGGLTTAELVSAIGVTDAL